MSEFTYITSPSYSGSTLLSFLLATHPQVSTIGELKAQAMGDITIYDCSCGMRIRDCPFWKQVGEELARQGVNFDPANFGTHFRCQDRSITDRVLRARVRGTLFERARKIILRAIPGTDELLRNIFERNRLFVDVISSIQGGRVFLDASKDAVRLKYLQNSGLWNIRVIYLIRDGRGTACSYMKHHGISMQAAAREWRNTHEECEQLISNLPATSWIKVRYEDLCREPDENLQKIFRFIGLEHSEAAQDFQTVEHHIIGNAMRLHSTNEIKLDEKWKSTLSHSELDAFDRIAGSLNRSYGYE